MPEGDVTIKILFYSKFDKYLPFPVHLQHGNDPRESGMRFGSKGSGPSETEIHDWIETVVSTTIIGIIP